MVENAGCGVRDTESVKNAGSVENVGSVENAGSTVENAESIVEKLVHILKTECYMNKANVWFEICLFLKILRCNLLRVWFIIFEGEILFNNMKTVGSRFDSTKAKPFTRKRAWKMRMVAHERFY